VWAQWDWQEGTWCEAVLQVEKKGHYKKKSDTYIIGQYWLGSFVKELKLYHYHSGEQLSQLHVNVKFIESNEKW